MRSRAASGDARGGLGEGTDPVGAVARPVLLAGDDDGGLHVAEGLHVVQGDGIGADVDDDVVEAVFIQGAVGGIALHASGLAVNGDSHRGGFLHSQPIWTRRIHRGCTYSNRRNRRLVALTATRSEERRGGE